jgi:hypothetical protein
MSKHIGQIDLVEEFLPGLKPVMTEHYAAQGLRKAITSVNIHNLAPQEAITKILISVRGCVHEEHFQKVLENMSQAGFVWEEPRKRFEHPSSTIDGLLERGRMKENR